ncbi:MULTISPECIES: hypothetical protein [unclassified Pseudomonas]|uniref:hypothetical protein n=1 Tax=unclassified Pseudomonas TaxID=196821 RepID=UPI00129E3B28|nr:hypothetical protein [Pseudomonas sp. BN606]MDH4654834.1 hypothetical protein [Pseudomonas sp. BN606]MRK23782.1 hypothetical protein [Pseudomonas sp. JG-B]
MRLIQFESTSGQRHVGVIEGERGQLVRGAATTRALALAAIAARSGLQDEVLTRGTEPGPNYRLLLESAVRDGHLQPTRSGRRA